jgi:hypothetical protein
VRRRAESSSVVSPPNSREEQNEGKTRFKSSEHTKKKVLLILVLPCSSALSVEKWNRKKGRRQDGATCKLLYSVAGAGEEKQSENALVMEY